MYLEISNPMDYHVALYIRLSKEDESEGPSESVTNQKSLLNEFVQQHRLSVYDTYIDDGWSGTSFNRPAFQRMIGDIETKKVNMVITKDLSRLGRDYIMTGHYMERYFPEKRVRYISLLDGIDTGIESTANDITPFRAIMNDMYAKDISKKIKSVKHDKQQKGQFIGGKPVYGYKMHPTEKNKIVIDEAVAPIVRRIFAMALTGMSCRRIAMVLNEEGIPTPATYCGWQRRQKGPYSGLWSSERISDMLKNETYIGNMVQGKSVKISYKSQKCIKQEQSMLWSSFFVTLVAKKIVLINLCCRPCFIWGSITIITVWTNMIIINVCKFFYLLIECFLCCKLIQICAFILQGIEVTLHRCIVVRISCFAHALCHIYRFAEFGKCFGRIL